MPFNSSMFSIPVSIPSQAMPSVIVESSNRPRRNYTGICPIEHISCAGRRRNVALVRREGLINQGFLALRFSRVRCDDFLTWALTSFDGRAYKPTTERGGAGAQRPRQASAPVKLLSWTSEQTADSCRLSFGVG
jgi:hypothetical protein